MNMNNSLDLDLGSLRLELEKQKQERELLKSVNDLAIIKHQNDLEEDGEQSPSNEKVSEIGSHEVIVSDVKKDKVILWRCARDYFQPNIKLKKQYSFDNVVIEESKDCYVVYSSDVELAVKTLYDNFDFEIAGFGICRSESDNQDYVEELIYQGILRGFSIFPSRLWHEKELQQKSTTHAFKRIKADIKDEVGIMATTKTLFLQNWLDKTEKGLMLST